MIVAQGCACVFTRVSMDVMQRPDLRSDAVALSW